MNKASTIIILLLILGLSGMAYFMIKGANDETTNTNATSTPPVVITPPVSKAGAPVVSADSNSAVTNSTVVVTGSVKPNGAQTTYRYEYGKTNTLGSKTSTQNIGSGFGVIPATGYITGLTPSTLYYFRLSAENSFGTSNSTTKTFTTHATTPPPQTTDVPAASTIAADDITRVSADLKGNVNPKGSTTSYWFEYGATDSLGLATNIRSAGSGTSAQAVSVSIDGLSPNTKYFFRINAQNAFGTVNGSILSFTTDAPSAILKPTTEIKAATAIASTSATINGMVTPNGAETSYWFEYSTDSLVGNIIANATQEKILASGAGATQVNASLTQLAKNTKYNFRLVAKNSQGTVRSEVMSFTTSGN